MTEELERSGAAVFFLDPDKIGDIPIVDMVPYLLSFEKEELAEAHVDHMEEVTSELEKQAHEQTDIAGTFCKMEIPLELPKRPRKRIF